MSTVQLVLTLEEAHALQTSLRRATWKAQEIPVIEERLGHMIQRAERRAQREVERP